MILCSRANGRIEHYAMTTHLDEVIVIKSIIVSNFNCGKRVKAIS